jgi:transposase
VSFEREDTSLSEWLVGKKAVANALGVSVSTVKRYMKRYPDFPANRRGGAIYVSPEALNAWVENRAVKRCLTCGVALPA